VLPPASVVWLRISLLVCDRCSTPPPLYHIGCAYKNETRSTYPFAGDERWQSVEPGIQALSSSTTLPHTPRLIPGHTLPGVPPSVDPSTSGSIRAEIRCPTVQSVQPHSRDGARTIPKSTEPHPFKGPRPCLRFQTSPRQPRVDNPSARWAAGEQRAGGEARLRYIEPTANASYPPSPTFCATFPVEGHGALFGLDSMRWLRVGCGACAWLH